MTYIPEKEQGNVFQASPQDEALLKAKQEAQEKFLQFVGVFVTHGSDPKFDLSIKVTLREGETAEHLWLVPVEIDAKGIYGKVSNDPIALTSTKMGDFIRVPIQDVNDWVIIDFAGKKVRGGFSVKAMGIDLLGQLGIPPSAGVQWLSD